MVGEHLGSLGASRLAAILSPGLRLVSASVRDFGTSSEPGTSTDFYSDSTSGYCSVPDSDCGPDPGCDPGSGSGFDADASLTCRPALICADPGSGTGTVFDSSSTSAYDPGSGPGFAPAAAPALDLSGFWIWLWL